MDSKKNAIIIVLRRISSLINKMSEDEISNLLSGKFDIQILGTKKSKKQSNIVDDKVIEDYLFKLHMINDREKGRKLLKNEKVDRSFLKRIAEKIDIPNTSRDNIEMLTEKIIEATIGYRLRSEAMRDNVNIVLPNRKFKIKK